MDLVLVDCECGVYPRVDKSALHSGYILNEVCRAVYPSTGSLCV